MSANLLIETDNSTLRDLRLKAGLSHDQIVVRVGQILGKAPKSKRASVLWEFRGVRDVDTLTALAEIYGVDLPTVRKAALQSRVTPGFPALSPGQPRRKNLS